MDEESSTGPRSRSVKQRLLLALLIILPFIIVKILYYLRDRNRVEIDNLVEEEKRLDTKISNITSKMVQDEENPSIVSDYILTNIGPLSPNTRNMGLQKHEYFMNVQCVDIGLELKRGHKKIVQDVCCTLHSGHITAIMGKF